MRIVFFVHLLFLFSVACKPQENSVEIIEDSIQQGELFEQLVNLTSNEIPPSILNDSTAFLLLPIQAICPSCRKKIIDSIVANENILDNKHFIIISANGGRKTMDAFFKERGHNWPNLKKGLFLDSTNQAFKIGLYKDKPVFFYGYKNKVSKKVSSIPATIKEDLRLFFNNKAR